MVRRPLIRQTLVWLLLVGVTAASWAFTHYTISGIPTKTASSVLLALAFFKTRFILLEFMELRDAVLPARLFVEVWGVVVCAVLITLLWMSS